MEPTVPLCIYHGDCFDGFGAAWVVHDAFEGQVELFEGIHGQPPPNVQGRDVIMVDFTYKIGTMTELVDKAAYVLILDHHETARNDFENMRANGKWSAHFDMNRSGAGIAWDYYHPEQPRPPLIDYIEDRDLWRFALPDSRLVHAGLSSYPREIDQWHQMMHWPITRFKDEGEAIERKHLVDVTSAIKVATRKMVIGGYEVEVTNAPITLCSDVGNQLATRNPFGVSYFDGANGRNFSLRSVSGSDIHVGEIAQRYGGGGHKHAAGFQAPRNFEGDSP